MPFFSQCGQVEDVSKKETFAKIFFSSNGLNFRHKHKALIHIVKTDSIYSDFLRDNPTFLNTLDKFISNRNDMAHSILHTTEEDIKNFDGDTIKYYCYKPNKKGEFTKRLLPVKYSSLLMEANNIHQALQKMKELINVKAPNKK